MPAILDAGHQRLHLRDDPGTSRKAVEGTFSTKALNASRARRNRRNGPGAPESILVTIAMSAGSLTKVPSDSSPPPPSSRRAHPRFGAVRS
jgi:hypothetical protein